MTLAKRLLHHCRSQFPFLAGARLAVAVSGGMDSVVLLDLLLEIRRALELELVVATVDHGTRVGESATDAAFVRGLAAARGLPCYCGRFDGLRGYGREDAARRARMAFLVGVPADAVALAHHRDDQAETVLLRLLRSASMDGVGGMRPHRSPFVRPLLNVPQDELRTWAAQRGLRWRQDASNQDSSLERNRVRSEVLPGLEVVHGGVADRLVALAEAARSQSEALSWAGSEHVRDAPWLSRSQLAALPDALAIFALRAHLRQRAGFEPGIGREGWKQCLALLRTGRPGAWLPLPSGWRWAVSDGSIFCLPPPPEALRLRLTGRRRWGVYNVITEHLTAARHALVLRPPLAGERFGGQPLREWLRRRGVPAPLRSYHPVFCRAERVVWVPGGAPRTPLVHALGLAITVTGSIPTFSAPGRSWNAKL
jgi:tRNA(Ile)-lysidine synthetase-like protein